MSDPVARQGSGAALASIVAGVLGLAGLLVIGLQLRGLAAELDALEDRIDKLPQAPPGSAVPAAAGPKAVTSAAEMGRLFTDLSEMEAAARKIQQEQDRRILVDPKAELPGLGRADLAKFAGEYIEIRDRSAREAFAKERLDRCIQLADQSYLKQNLAVNLKLDEDQQQKISSILGEELGRCLEYLGRREHDPEEATALKNSILSGAERRILEVLHPDQARLYPKYKADWIGGMIHIAGER